MPRLTLSASPSSFAAASAIYLLPAFPLVAALAALSSTPAPTDIDGTLRGTVTALLLGCVVAPGLETFLLMYASALARQAIARYWLACIVGAVPVILVHAPWGWQKIVGVTWAFVWSAHCYYALTEQGVSFRTRYAFLAGMHSLANGVLIGLQVALRI